jgi:membrane protease YdiL (CAAX protease family)
MPLDPTFFLHATYAFYVTLLIIGVLAYGKYKDPTDPTLRPNERINLESIGKIDFLGVGLLLALFILLMLEPQGGTPDKSKEITLTPFVMIAGMISQAVPGLIVLVLLMARGIKFSDFFGLRWSWENARHILVIAPVGVIITYLFMFALETLGYSGWLVTAFGQEIKVQDAVRIYQETDAVVIRALLAISAVIIAPIVEEVVFRGYIYTVTKRFTGRIFSTLASALVFGVVHNYIPGLLPLAFLAVLLTVSYELTGSLWAPISIHALFNASTLIVQEIQFHQN